MDTSTNLTAPTRGTMSDLEDLIQQQRDRLGDLDDVASARMRAIYQSQAQAVMVQLERVTRRIDEARKAGVEVHPDWLRRQNDYVRLVRQLDDLQAGFSRDGARMLDQLQLDARGYGATDGRAQAEMAGYSFQQQINVPATERFVSALDPDSPVREVLDSYGTNARNVITKELSDGMALGRGPREIIRAIKRQIVQDPQRNIDALVRTEMMRAYRGSLFDQYAKGGVQTWVWRCAHNARTCLACLARDGSEHPMTDRFMQAHVCCRCIPSPKPRRLYVEEPITGEAWLRQQPESVQRARMPSKAAWEAWQSGDLKLIDFVGIRRSRKWGDSVYERSGVQALAAAEQRRQATARRVNRTPQLSEPKSEPHPHNPAVRKSAGGVWGEDQLPVAPWESPQHRVVVPEDLQRRTSIPESVIRWASKKRETVIRDHATDRSQIENIESHLSEWTMAGQEPGVDAWAIVFEDGGYAYVAVISTDRNGSTNMVTVHRLREKQIQKYRDAEWMEKRGEEK